MWSAPARSASMIRRGERGCYERRRLARPRVVERPHVDRLEPVREVGLARHEPGRGLAHAVRRQWLRRRVFPYRYVRICGAAVLLGAAGHDHAPRTARARGLDDVERAFDVHAEHGCGRLPRRTDVRERREVVHDVGGRSGDRGSGPLSVAHVEAVGAVEHHHIVARFVQMRAQVAPDEPATTRDDGPHQPVRPCTAARYACTCSSAQAVQV